MKIQIMEKFRYQFINKIEDPNAILEVYGMDKEGYIVKGMPVYDVEECITKFYPITVYYRKAFIIDSNRVDDMDSNIFFNNGKNK